MKASILKTPIESAKATVWDGTIDTTWYTNNKSAKTYIITTPQQLAGLAKMVNNNIDFVGKTIKLSADIMLNDTVNWQNWATTPPRNTWTTIGTYDYKDDGNKNLFSGTFDGKGHVISGVYINNENSIQGLFGYVYCGTIKNVGVVAFYIRGDGNVGGLVGKNEEGIVSNSYSIGTVSGRFNVGGLVGVNCESFFVDWENKEGIVRNSYSISTVSSKSRVGGLVGDNSGGTISNSYSTGVVSGTESVGGLVGDNEEGTVSNSYYNKQTSGQSDTGKGEGKTTADMKKQNTYIDWDFKNIWAIDTKINNGYPHLINNQRRQK